MLQPFYKTTFNAFIMLLMMIIVMPCTLKQEIKKALHIPVATEGISNPNKTQSCSTVVDNKTSTSCVAIQKKTVNNCFDPINYDKVVFPDGIKKNVESTQFVSAIPIYIIQQQFLI